MSDTYTLCNYAQKTGMPGNATPAADGLMSASDKSKLDGIEAGAHVNPGNATPAADGLMSASDKSKLDALTVGITDNMDRVYTCEVSGEDLVPAPEGGAYLILPGVARYNAGFGLTELSCDGVPLILGTHWYEQERPSVSRPDNSTAYWTQRVRIVWPQEESMYRFIWRELVVTDYIRGLREVHVGSQAVPGKKATLISPTNYPNGVAWDPLPAGYKVEIWRKTKHKQGGTHLGIRWMLLLSVPAERLEMNLVPISAGRGQNTVSCRFAYLRPDGARSCLSQEIAIYHAGSGWGPDKRIPGGRVRLK